VFRKNLAGWTLGLSAAVAACALVAAYAASWWLKAAAVAAALGCGAGFLALRASLLRAARVRMPDFPWHEGRPPWHLTLWAAGAAALVLASVTAGFVSYDAAGLRTAAPTAGAAAPPAQAQPPKKPLPVGVTFRPSAGGPGQVVYLTGAAGIEPLTVDVRCRQDGPEPWVPPSLPGRSPAKNAAVAVADIWLRLELEKGRWVSGRAVVRPGAEAEVVWVGGAHVRVAPGQAIALTCPGYESLVTTVPPAAASPAFQAPAGSRPALSLSLPAPAGQSAPPRRPAPALSPLRPMRTDPEQLKRAREAVAGQLTASFRDSLVGRGKVLVLANAGPAAAPAIRVRVLRPSRVVRGTDEVVAEYSLANGLGAGQKAEVGWLELDKELQGGDRVELLMGDDVVKSALVE
jgi:hypothetical protein